MGFRCLNSGKHGMVKKIVYKNKGDENLYKLIVTLTTVR